MIFSIAEYLTAAVSMDPKVLSLLASDAAHVGIHHPTVQDHQADAVFNGQQVRRVGGIDARLEGSAGQ